LRIGHVRRFGVRYRLAAQRASEITDLARQLTGHHVRTRPKVPFSTTSAVPRGEAALTRTDPVVAAVANFALSAALDRQAPAAHRPARRCGVIRTSIVPKRTVVLLARYRFQLVLMLVANSTAGGPGACEPAAHRTRNGTIQANRPGQPPDGKILDRKPHPAVVFDPRSLKTGFG
jgi:hypothetical protein